MRLGRLQRSLLQLIFVITLLLTPFASASSGQEAHSAPGKIGWRIHFDSLHNAYKSGRAIQGAMRYAFHYGDIHVEGESTIRCDAGWVDALRTYQHQCAIPDVVKLIEAQLPDKKLDIRSLTIGDSPLCVQSELTAATPGSHPYSILSINAQSNTYGLLLKADRLQLLYWDKSGGLMTTENPLIGGRQLFTQEIQPTDLAAPHAYTMNLITGIEGVFEIANLVIDPGAFVHLYGCDMTP